MPRTNPTLFDDGDATISISALTIHGAFAQLWISPPTSKLWEQRKEVATAHPPPRFVEYNVVKGTALGWRLDVATTGGASDYEIALTVTQGGAVVKDGVLLVRGKTTAKGVASDEDAVILL